MCYTMLKLPVCPHCQTIYYYDEVMKSTKQKTMECYHCKKEFTVKKWRGRFILMSVVVAVMAVIDVLLLCVIKMQSAIPIMIFTVICVLCSLLLLPYTVRYK